MNEFTPTSRSRVKRAPLRAHYDEASVYGILDSAILAHIGYVLDNQPFVTPTFYWRNGNILYWHGSSASRMIRAQATGLDVCVTVTLLDGLVLARSAFNHSANYRSVMAFGRTRLVTDRTEKEEELNNVVERFLPNRLPSLRPNSEKELKATSLIAMEILEASAKIRSGPPEDDEEDYQLNCWAGIMPIRQIVGEIIADPKLKPGIDKPDHLDAFSPGTDFTTLMKEFA